MATGFSSKEKGSTRQRTEENPLPTFAFIRLIKEAVSCFYWKRNPVVCGLKVTWMWAELLSHRHAMKEDIWRVLKRTNTPVEVQIPALKIVLAYSGNTAVTFLPKALNTAVLV